jgi:hypothetical protein
MKKIAVAAIATLAACLTANVASAQTVGTQIITVSGTIEPETVLNINSTATLNLKAGSQKIADLSVTSNQAGKTVTTTVKSDCTLKSNNGTEIKYSGFRFAEGTGNISIGGSCTQTALTFDPSTGPTKDYSIYLFKGGSGSDLVSILGKNAAAGTYTGKFEVTVSVND